MGLTELLCGVAVSGAGTKGGDDVSDGDRWGKKNCRRTDKERVGAFCRHDNLFSRIHIISQLQRREMRVAWLNTLHILACEVP
jgi:hypothetical protein